MGVDESEGCSCLLPIDQQQQFLCKLPVHLNIVGHYLLTICGVNHLSLSHQLLELRNCEFSHLFMPLDSPHSELIQVKDKISQAILV